MSKIEQEVKKTMNVRAFFEAVAKIISQREGVQITIKELKRKEDETDARNNDRKNRNEETKSTKY